MRIPSGLRTREDLVIPLGNFLRRRRVRFVAAEATGLSSDGRVVHAGGEDVANYLRQNR